MIVPSNRVRIVVATRPVDFRKGHDGLAAVVNASPTTRSTVSTSCSPWNCASTEEQEAVA